MKEHLDPQSFKREKALMRHNLAHGGSLSDVLQEQENTYGHASLHERPSTKLEFAPIMEDPNEN